MLRKRGYTVEGYHGWDPPETDKVGEAYYDMEDALRTMELTVDRLSGKGRPVSDREITSAVRDIQSAMKGATETDMETAIQDARELLKKLESALNKVDDAERKRPEKKTQKDWMHRAGSVTKAFGKLDRLIPKMSKHYRSM